MPTHAEKRRLPYPPRLMFDLVADVGRYPEFLPWCAGARVRGRRPGPEGSEIMDVDLVISFKLFRERFGSRVTLRPEALRIDVEYLDGPFRYLNNHWVFRPSGEDGCACEVDFFVDFELRARPLQAVIGVVFNEAMRRIVRAFEDRAAALHGPGANAGGGQETQS